MSYEELRAWLCEAHPGWSYHTVDHMSFEQIDCALRGGKRPKGPTASTIEEARELAADMAQNWRKYYGV